MTYDERMTLLQQQEAALEDALHALEDAALAAIRAASEIRQTSALPNLRAGRMNIFPPSELCRTDTL